MTPGVPDPRGLFRLVRILREIRPDILQTWLYHADFMGLMAYRLGCAPHLLWNIRCSDMSGIALGGISSVLRWMLSRQSTWPDAIVVNSRTGQQFHESIGYRPRRWELLPNGFDTCELRPDLDTRQRFRTGLALSDDHFNRLARALSPHERSRYVSGRRRPPRRDQNPGSLSVGRKRGRRGQPPSSHALSSATEARTASGYSASVAIWLGSMPHSILRHRPLPTAKAFQMCSAKRWPAAYLVWQPTRATRGWSLVKRELLSHPVILPRLHLPGSS